MFFFNSNKDNKENDNMTEAEKKEYNRKHKNSDSKDEWDKLIDMDTLGFFDDDH